MILKNFKLKGPSNRLGDKHVLKLTADWGLMLVLELLGYDICCLGRGI